MSIKRLLALLLLISSCLLIDAQEVADTNGDELQEDIPPINCVFVGCSCQGDEDTVILQNSNELEEASPDARLAKDVSYDLLCKDEDNPDFKFKSFPLRDNSKVYSHQILTLDLANNAITTVPSHRLKNLEISSAILRENLINNIDEDAFKDVIKLESLDLSVNKLTDLNERTFVPVQASLMHLKINENKLGEMSVEKLEKVLNGLKKLASLHLSSNELKSLPNLSQTQLTELVLQSNQIESLNDYKQLLPSSLIDLNVNNNRMKQLTAQSLAKLVNLKYLNLESNQIATISEDAFTHLTKLTQIHMAKNYLKQIRPRQFFTLIDLQRLDLSSQNQMLKEIDDYAFDRRSNARDITKIDLSKNRITSLGAKVFCSRNQSRPYANIKELDLAVNPISSINPCVMRQMAKGFADVNNQQVNPKVTFKPTHVLEKIAPTIKCDCDIAKAALLIDFEGDCENEQGNTVELKKYKCNSDTSRDEVEKSCESLAEFDCSDQSNKDEDIFTTDKNTFKQQGVDANPTKPDDNRTNKNRPSDIQNNPNTKLPVKEAGTNTKIESSAVVSMHNGIVLSFTLIVSSMITIF